MKIHALTIKGDENGEWKRACINILWKREEKEIDQSCIN